MRYDPVCSCFSPAMREICLRIIQLNVSATMLESFNAASFYFQCTILSGLIILIHRLFFSL